MLLKKSKMWYYPGFPINYGPLNGMITKYCLIYHKPIYKNNFNQTAFPCQSSMFYSKFIVT